MKGPDKDATEATEMTSAESQADAASTTVSKHTRKLARPAELGRLPPQGQAKAQKVPCSGPGAFAQPRAAVCARAGLSFCGEELQVQVRAGPPPSCLRREPSTSVGGRWDPVSPEVKGSCL